MAQAEAGGALSHLNHEIVASLDDFQDPSQEWRRLFSELFGTFFLVLVAAGGGMMGQAFPGTISRGEGAGSELCGAWPRSCPIARTIPKHKTLSIESIELRRQPSWVLLCLIVLDGAGLLLLWEQE